MRGDGDNVRLGEVREAKPIRRRRIDPFEYILAPNYPGVDVWQAHGKVPDSRVEEDDAVIAINHGR